MIFSIDPVGAVRYSKASGYRPDWARYAEYKTALAWMAAAHRYEISVPLSLRFVLPMPASWSAKKKAEQDGQPHRSKPDLDNLIKGFKDALLSEDSAVWQYGPMEKRWGTAGAIVVLS